MTATRTKQAVSALLDAMSHYRRGAIELTPPETTFSSRTRQALAHSAAFAGIPCRSIFETERATKLPPATSTGETSRPQFGGVVGPSNPTRRGSPKVRNQVHGRIPAALPISIAAAVGIVIALLVGDFIHVEDQGPPSAVGTVAPSGTAPGASPVIYLSTLAPTSNAQSIRRVGPRSLLVPGRSGGDGPDHVRTLGYVFAPSDFEKFVTRVEFRGPKNKKVASFTLTINGKVAVIAMDLTGGTSLPLDWDEKAPIESLGLAAAGDPEIDMVIVEPRLVP